MIDFFKCPQHWLDFFYRDDVKSLVDKTDEKNFEPFYKIDYHRVNVVIVGMSGNPEYPEYLYSLDHVSKSFKEIYKELENEGYYPTKDGNIDHWYKNGILFFDTSTLPSILVEKIIHFLKEKKDLIWFFLSDKKDLPNMSEIDSPYMFFQNPLSKSFTGSNVFKKIDKILKAKGMDPISW